MGRRGQRGHGAVRSAAFPAWLFVASLLVPPTAGCQSTALSLGDPNKITAEFTPSYWDPTIADPADPDRRTIHVSLLGVDDPGAAAADVRTIGAWDFGEGLRLGSGWSFDPGKNFSLSLPLLRTADAPRGLRVLQLQIDNPLGSFLARGEFTLF